MSFINDFYKEAIQVGKIQTGISIIYSIIILIFVIIIWFTINKVFIAKNADTYNDVIGKIEKSTCEYYLTEKNGGNYSCDLEVTYEIEGKKYTNNIISNNSFKHKIGSNINLQYKKDDPNIIKIKSDTKMINYIMCFIIIFILIGCFGPIFRYYMANKYNMYSSTYGTGSAFGHGFKSPI